MESGQSGRDGSWGPQPRIGTGRAWFVVSAVFFGVGLFALLAASGGAHGAAGVGAICVAVGASCAGIGLLVRLFGIIERRLIDIRQASPRS